MTLQVLLSTEKLQELLELGDSLIRLHKEVQVDVCESLAPKRCAKGTDFIGVSIVGDGISSLGVLHSDPHSTGVLGISVKGKNSELIDVTIVGDGILSLGVLQSDLHRMGVLGICVKGNNSELLVNSFGPDRPVAAARVPCIGFGFALGALLDKQGAVLQEPRTANIGFRGQCIKGTASADAVLHEPRNASIGFRGELTATVLGVSFAYVLAEMECVRGTSCTATLAGACLMFLSLRTMLSMERSLRQLRGTAHRDIPTMFC